MELDIKNIGKIGHANIKIDGISVIAGENNTGKSTIGKVLSCVFNAFHNPEKRTRKEQIRSITKALFPLRSPSKQRYISPRILERIAEQIVDEYANTGMISAVAVEKTVLDSLFAKEDLFRVEDEGDLRKIAHRIQTLLSVDEHMLFSTVLWNNLSSEFYDQVLNIHTQKPGEISLTISGDTTRIVIENDCVSDISKIFKLDTICAYIDTPLVLDNDSYFFSSDSSTHRDFLRTLLLKPTIEDSPLDEIIANEKIRYVESVLDKACAGTLSASKNGKRMTFQEPGATQSLDARNLSSGLKTFAILKLLLKKGILEDNGTLVLDEPEIHLHPEWQLLFAEAIVLLQKEFGMHVLLTTHSPYFLNAIEVYSAKYHVADKCKFYLAHNEESLSFVSDVTNRTEAIYYQLARPLQDLENGAYDFD